MKTRFGGLLLSTAICTLGVSATAQQLEFNTIYLGELVLSSEGAASVEISDEELENGNPADLQDVFKGEPTIAVGSSIPMSQKVYVNGIEETNLNVKIDGARQNNKLFHHNATNLIDPDLLKGVRIEPGVATADSGPAALAGSIVYETKDASDLLAADDNFGAFVRGEYISNGDIFASSGSVYGRFGGFEYLAYAKTADGGERKDGDGDTIIGSETNLMSGLAKLAYESEGHRVELSFEQVDDDATRPFRANGAQFLGGGRAVPLTRTYPLKRQNTVLSYRFDGGEGWVNPELTLSYSVTSLETMDTVNPSDLINFLPDVELPLTTFGETDSVNFVLKNTAVLRKGTVTFGLDYYSDEAFLKSHATIPFLGFVQLEGSEKSENVGLFAQARLDLNDSTRVSFGARKDWQDFEGIRGEEFSDSGVSGNLSVEYDVNDALSVSGGYSHVWGGVALAENYLIPVIPPQWTYPQDGIEAATSRNLYLAAKANFGAWSLNGKVFKTDLNDVRDPETAAGGAALLSDAKTEGYELGVAYNWGAGYARLGYADIDTEINGNPADSGTGQYLAVPVGQILTAQVTHSFDDWGLLLGADARHAFSSSSFIPGDTPAEDRPGQDYPSYTVVNAFAEYTPRSVPNLTIRGEVNNLFDEQYADRTTFGQEYGEDSLVPLYEPGRSFTLSATMRF